MVNVMINCCEIVCLSLNSVWHYTSALRTLSRSHLDFVLAEERVDPFCEGLLLDVETLVSQSPDPTFLEVEVVLVRLPVGGHLADGGRDSTREPPTRQSVTSYSISQSLNLDDSSQPALSNSFLT